MDFKNFRALVLQPPLLDPPLEGQRGLDQESALPLASKGKRSKACSGKCNSRGECKASGVSLPTRSKLTPSVSKCDPVSSDKDSHSLKTRGRRTRKTSLPSVGTEKWHNFKFLIMCVGLLDDFDLSEPEPEGYDKDSALPLASKGKRTKARSGKVNSSGV